MPHGQLYCRGPTVEQSIPQHDIYCGVLQALQIGTGDFPSAGVCAVRKSANKSSKLGRRGVMLTLYILHLGVGGVCGFASCGSFKILP